MINDEIAKILKHQRAFIDSQSDDCWRVLGQLLEAAIKEYGQEQYEKGKAEQTNSSATAEDTNRIHTLLSYKAHLDSLPDSDEVMDAYFNNDLFLLDALIAYFWKHHFKESK